MDEAACRNIDPDEFFPESVVALKRSDAPRVCKSCPVQVECAAFAARTGTGFGIWGAVNKKIGRPTRVGA